MLVVVVVLTVAIADVAFTMRPKIEPCGQVYKLSEDPMQIVIADGQHFISTEMAVCVNPAMITDEDFKTNAPDIRKTISDYLSSFTLEDIYWTGFSAEDLQYLKEDPINNFRVILGERDPNSFAINLNNIRIHLVEELSNNYPGLEDIYYSSFLVDCVQTETNKIEDDHTSVKALHMEKTDTISSSFLTDSTNKKTNMNIDERVSDSDEQAANGMEKHQGEKSNIGKDSSIYEQTMGFVFVLSLGLLQLIGGIKKWEFLKLGGNLEWKGFFRPMNTYTLYHFQVVMQHT